MIKDVNLKVGDKVIRIIDNTFIPKDTLGKVQKIDQNDRFSYYSIAWDNGVKCSYSKQGLWGPANIAAVFAPYKKDIDLSKAKRVKIRTLDDMCHDPSLIITEIASNGCVTLSQKEQHKRIYYSDNEKEIPKNRIVKVFQLSGGSMCCSAKTRGYNIIVEPEMVEEIVEYIEEPIDINVAITVGGKVIDTKTLSRESLQAIIEASAK